VPKEAGRKWLVAYPVEWYGSGPAAELLWIEVGSDAKLFRVAAVKFPELLRCYLNRRG